MTDADRHVTVAVFHDSVVKKERDEKTKIRLATKINQSLSERGLTQEQAAALLQIKQPKVSALMRCNLEGFSVERLLKFLNALDCDVDIVLRIKPSHRRLARIQVKAA